MPKAKAKPGQLKAYDNVMDRLEFATLLNHLSPARRLAFQRWMCSHAILPGTVAMNPVVQHATVELAKRALRCDRANEALTMDCIMVISHFAINWGFDIAKALDHLTLMARGKA